MLWQWGCYGFDSYLGPFWVMGRYKKDPYLPMEEIFAIQRGVNKKTLDLLQFLVNILPPKNCSPQKITFSTIYYFSVTYSHHTFSISLAHQQPKCQDSHFCIKVRLIFSLICLRHSFQLQQITLRPLILLIRPIISDKLF